MTKVNKYMIDHVILNLSLLSRLGIKFCIWL